MTENKCNNCDITKNLQFCENCKLISYCSKECQILDLSKHSEFCKKTVNVLIQDEENKIDIIKSIIELAQKNNYTRFIPYEGRLVMALWQDKERNLGDVIRLGNPIFDNIPKTLLDNLKTMPSCKIIIIIVLKNKNTICEIICRKSDCKCLE